MKFNCVFGVEELRTLTNLPQISLSERSLDYDIDQVLPHRVGLIYELVIEVHHRKRILQHYELVLGFLDLNCEGNILLKLLQHVDLLT